MSMLDKIKAKLKGHEDKTNQGIDKAGDRADDRTGNKYQGQVDTGQDKLKDEFGQDRPSTDGRASLCADPGTGPIPRRG